MKYLFSILLLCSVINCKAQFNDTVRYHVNLASNGNINNTTISSAYVFSNAARFGVRKKVFSCNGSLSWLYGEQQHKLTNNDFVSTLNFNLYKTLPKFYYWGLCNYTSNYSLKINDQFQGGAGVAYSFIDKKDAYFNISDGLLYEHSDIRLGDTANSTYSTYRNSLRVSFRFVWWQLITLSNMTFYQKSLNSSTDYIVNSNTSMGIKVRKWLSLTTTFNYNRFNRTGRENTLLQYGITIDQYF